ncbi:hypothetical protein HDV02_001597 [Globomyces sp. JEL0801]|nr:hypothetical protein HDV02_001597 [Globomyces sp. JEL0801]
MHWIVSSDSIIEVETNVNKNHPESASSRTFTIVTKTDRYKFQASTSQEVQRWKFLLQSKLKMKSLVSNYSENTLLESDSAQVSLNQQNSLYQFIRVQLQWKKALMAVLSKNERARFNITTIQIAPDGVHILYGTVRFYKEEAHTEGNTNLNKLHILGGDSELPKTITSPAKSRFSVDRSKRRGSGSHFIDDQIAELDREIIATKPTSFF